MVFNSSLLRLSRYQTLLVGDGLWHGCNTSDTCQPFKWEQHDIIVALGLRSSISAYRLDTRSVSPTDYRISLAKQYADSVEHIYSHIYSTYRHRKRPKVKAPGNIRTANR